MTEKTRKPLEPESPRQQPPRPDVPIGSDAYRLMLDNAGLGMGYWSLDGTCLMLNRRACEDMGSGGPGLVGRNIRDLFGAEGAVYLERIHDVAAAGSPRTYRDEVPMPHGLRVYDSTYAPIPGDDGRIDGVQIISSDVTKSTELEEQVRQFQRVEAIGRLAGGVAHDLNNLLSPILGYGDMLLQDLSDADLRTRSRARVPARTISATALRRESASDRSCSSMSP